MSEERLNRMEVRRAINKAGHEFFKSIYNANKDLGFIAGEFMALNEEYVLNHSGEEETNATVDILQSGFTTNQKSTLERLRDMQLKSGGKAIKIKAEITDGNGYHKVLFLVCDVKMRDKAIEVAERFLRWGLSKIEV